MPEASGGIAVPDDFHVDIGVCPNLAEVFKSRTFAYVVIQAFRKSGITQEERIQEHLRTLHSILNNGRPSSSDLLALRQALQSQTFIDNAQQIFDSLEFKGMNTNGRAFFREIFERVEGSKGTTSIARRFALRVQKTIFTSLSKDDLANISDDTIAIEDWYAAESDHGQKFLEAKYSITSWTSHLQNLPSDDDRRPRYFYGSGKTAAWKMVHFTVEGARVEEK